MWRFLPESDYCDQPVKSTLECGKEGRQIADWVSMALLRACSRITWHFDAGPQARWLGASDEHAGLHARRSRQNVKLFPRRP